VDKVTSKQESSYAGLQSSTMSTVLLTPGKRGD